MNNIKNVEIVELLEIIKKSTSIAQVLKACNCPLKSFYYDRFKEIVCAHNIDISHFLGKSHCKGKIFPPKRDINDYLSGVQKIHTHTLKQKLIKQGIKEHKCEICGITEWCGKPTPIQLDHIDGNRNNNQLENLRIVCPNCHAQTDTYCGKQNKQITYCSCGNKKSKKSTLCSICNNSSQQRTFAKPLYRKVERPSKEELLELIKNKPFTHIGKLYNVTDNTIRRWCKCYGLPYRKKDII